MKRILGLFAALAVMWWLLSGYATALLLSFGVLSCLLVSWLSHRMHLTDHEGIPVLGMPRIALYWAWLTFAILKSNFDVAHRILTGRFSPAIKKIPVTQYTDQGRVTYANSITLTPGTLSYELESDVVHVHALNADSLNELEKGEMAKRVNRLEDES